MAARVQTLEAAVGTAAGLPAAGTGAGLSAPAASVPTPASGWGRVFGDWTVVGGAAAVCHALGAATSLLLRMLLDPAQMGIWQALKLLLSYGNYANLGISKGAARELTVALGQGQTSQAERGLNLAFTVNTLSSLFYAVLLVGAGIWIGRSAAGPWSGTWAAGLLLVGGLAVLGRYVTFHVTILRSRQAFAATARLAVLEAVLTLAVGGLATWRWGLPGLYLGTLVVMLAALGFVHRNRAATLTWAWDKTQIRRLIGIGSPILLAGAVSSLFRSLDKVMILAYVSDREFQLGCYSLALMVTAQLYGLGNMLSIVMGPRYGEQYGRLGDRGEVARLAARATELHAAATALPAAVAIAAAPPFLAWLLPDYQTGLAPLVWLVPGVVALVVALPATQYLIAVDCQRRALAAVVVATALAAVGNHVALTGGYGLVGVAAATALSYAAYFALSVGISIWIELSRRDRLRYASMLALALGPTVFLAVVLECIHPGAEAGWRTAVAKVAAVVLAWSLAVLAGWRHGRWRDAILPLAARQQEPLAASQ